jgi:hypothetical protein
VAANFRNRISMQPMRNRDMACRVLLFFSCGWEGVEWREGFSFQGVIGEESGQFTVQLDSEQSTFHASFCFCFFFFFGGRASGRGGS